MACDDEQCTLAISIVGGLLTGFIVKQLGDFASAEWFVNMAAVVCLRVSMCTCLLVCLFACLFNFDNPDTSVMLLLRCNLRTLQAMP